MVTMPPEVVRMRASSTVFVKASSLVKRDFADILGVICNTDVRSLTAAGSLRSFQRRSEEGRHGRECDGTDPRLRSGGSSSDRMS